MTLPEDGSAVISDGRDSLEVKTPAGGQVDTSDGSTTAQIVEINGITITAPEGETVRTDKDGASTVVDGATVSKGGVTVVIVDGAPVTVSKDGVITFPDGGTVTIIKNGQTTTQTVAAGGSINLDNLGGNDGGSTGDSSGGEFIGDFFGNEFTEGPSGGSSTGGNVSVADGISGGKVTIFPHPAGGGSDGHGNSHPR